MQQLVLRFIDGAKAALAQQFAQQIFAAQRLAESGPGLTIGATLPD
jgi:hypothetical protein